MLGVHSGANVVNLASLEKCCVDTAEDEPSKVSRKSGVLIAVCGVIRLRSHEKKMTGCSQLHQSLNESFLPSLNRKETRAFRIDFA